ncbi:MAG: chemotaxis protein CheW [Bdellovibrionia bacterium]
MINEKERDQIFKKRTELYSQRKIETDLQLEMNSVLVMVLNEQKYGIELAEIAGVFRISGFTPVPGAPDEFYGVTNLRGKVTTLINLKKLLGLTAKKEEKSAYAILLRASNGHFAVKVDSVDKNIAVDFKKLIRLDVLQTSTSTYTKGISLENLVVLDIAKILSQPIFKRNIR